VKLQIRSNEQFFGSHIGIVAVGDDYGLPATAFKIEGDVKRGLRATVEVDMLECDIIVEGEVFVTVLGKERKRYKLVPCEDTPETPQQ
jgi:hypothetical protein